jgi:hypothetical protein
LPALGLHTRKAGEDAGAPPGSGEEIASPGSSWNLSQQERAGVRESRATSNQLGHIMDPHTARLAQSWLGNVKPQTPAAPVQSSEFDRSRFKVQLLHFEVWHFLRTLLPTRA